VALEEQLLRLGLAHSLTSEQLDDPGDELSPDGHALHEPMPPELEEDGCSVFAGQF
tara:strand:- start:304 stop:471 length:168 start_codon:yes stop_codon:yes gene_type:complete